jgi:hypothetical protein
LSISFLLELSTTKAWKFSHRTLLHQILLLSKFPLLWRFGFCYFNHVLREEVTENVRVLDLKDATEEDIEQLKEIKNVGVIIAPEGLISKVSSKILENVGIILPYKEGRRLTVKRLC